MKENGLKLANMTVIFDGKTFAENKKLILKSKVDDLRKKGIVPTLVSIIVGDNPASLLYVNLKKKAAEEIGCNLLVVDCGSTITKEEITQKIKRYNQDTLVNGVMVQLPLPNNFARKDRDEIINSISEEKDVDGLREDSPYTTPVVRAVLDILKKAIGDNPNVGTLKIVVVGGSGFEGNKIVKKLTELDYNVTSLDKNSINLKSITKKADILISVTGSPRIIGKDAIKKGAVVIDVGAPKGDVRKDEIIGKASFLSPVPGGVGPVTIVCLLENLINTLNFCSKAIKI